MSSTSEKALLADLAPLELSAFAMTTFQLSFVLVTNSVGANTVLLGPRILRRG
jgi:succinate-acetate transporter protein